jgi:hypothetical protein
VRRNTPSSYLRGKAGGGGGKQQVKKNIHKKRRAVVNLARRLAPSWDAGADVTVLQSAHVFRGETHTTANGYVL